MIRKNLLHKIAGILIIVILFSWAAFPLDKRINLGLDLKGGMHLLLRVDTSKIPKENDSDAVELAIEKVRERIDKIGVSEPFIQAQGEDQIVVELPGITDRAQAKELIGQTGLLEFKLVNDNPDALSKAKNGETIEGFDYTKDEDGRLMLLGKTPSLTGDAIKNALAGVDQYGLPSVKLEFKGKGIEEFAKVTAEHINERLAIVLDGKVISAPVIRGKIDSGEAEISRGGGGFDPQEAHTLSVILRSGALPAPLLIEEERTIGPLLGGDSIRAGIKSSIIGCSLVFIFMAVYYLAAGLVACIALALNFLLILGSLGLLGLMGFPATLTLPGIAGIALTLGMAVDANVLINERIREELKLGKSLYSAIGNGYSKAFSAIWDSNITTVIAALFLFSFGTGPIRGFAITLIIGLTVSMFTATFVTRAIFEILLLNRDFKRLNMLRLIGQTKLDFIGRRKLFYGLSLGIIILGLIAYTARGRSVYGIDFAGGQIQEYAFNKPVKIEAIRLALKEAGIAESSIQQFKDSPNIVAIRTLEDTSELVNRQFTAHFKDNSFSLRRMEKVGPIAGRQLQKKAILALTLSLLGILIYVGFRFKHFNFGLAGVIALFHDIFVTVGILALLGKQIDLLIVTALLTIAGYSINDTIVIYDRVRENMRAMGKLTLAQVINLSVNQTLSRTILTSGVTLFMVLALFFWGGEILHNFALALIIGFTSGVYSTVYIASPLVMAWSRKRK